MRQRIPLEGGKTHTDNEQPSEPDYHHCGGTTGGVTTGAGAGVGAGVVVVPMPPVGAAAVGTDEVPITGTLEQILANEIPDGIGARALTEFVASRNIWPQLGLAQTWLRPIAKSRSASQSLASLRFNGDG